MKDSRSFTGAGIALTDTRMAFVNAKRATGIGAENGLNGNRRLRMSVPAVDELHGAGKPAMPGANPGTVGTFC